MNPIERVAAAIVRRGVRATIETRSMIRPVGGNYGGADVLRLSYREQRWTASSIAYRCIQAISSNASSLRLQVVREDGSEIEGHPLPRLWANPNPLMSGRLFGEYVWQRLETRGETFIYLDRGESATAQIGGMWPIFGNVTVLVDKAIAGEVVGYEVEVGGRRIPLLPSEVMWLRYPDADNEWGCIAPLNAAAHAIGLDALARAWQQNELRHGGRPTSVVYLGDLAEEQFNDTVATYRSKIEGAHNAGRALFVGGKTPAKVQRLSLTPEELGWLDTRSTAWEEIMVSWGVPKDYLLGGATYENRNAARSTLWSDAIVPKLEIVAGELARQVLAPGERARFDTDQVEALQESSDAKVERAVKATQSDLMLLDEGRGEIGLEPLPGGTGQLTISAYRAAVMLQAQQLLLQADPGARQMQPIPNGPLQLGRSTSTLALPSPVVRAGLSFDEAQHEYDVQERVGVRAVKRLSSKQEAIVLANLHKLFGRSGAWAAKRKELDLIAGSLVAARVSVTEGGDPLVVGLDVAERELRAKVDDLLDAAKAEQMTREQLEDFLTSVWTKGGSTTAKALGISFDTFDELVLTKMDERLAVLSELVTSTTRQALEGQVLLEGVANGETVDELAARVRAIFSGGLGGWRSQVIARTETVGGFNAASNVTAAGTGLVTARVWLATGDKRTRDSHVMLDGERLTKFDAQYPNGCRFPGDPMGPPAETIMCRCVEVYETD